MNKVAVGLDFACSLCILFLCYQLYLSLRVTLLQNFADGEKDTGQLGREKVEPRPTPHVSSGSSSSFGEPVGPEPVSPELVDSDTLTTSNVEV